MAKLVILSQGMTGRSHELKVDKTTIGRVDDNTFPITEASVSSHHCEVLLRGSDVVVHDLNSTNGTFINGEKITESVLKPGQILRLGQIELRLEGDQPEAGATATTASGTAAPAGKKALANTTVMQRGVSLTDLESGTRGGFDAAGKGFTKKDNKANKIFLYGAIAVGFVIVVLLAIAFFAAKKPAM
jgi:pSer/pThr/pTyr-binding forkhead associated (FHA) protein